MGNRQDLTNGYETLFVEHFDNDNYFATTLHEGGIAGVAQDIDDQDKNNDNENSNTE